ncbi:MAG: hypothetical protein AB7G06_08670 [Bdellovibrionales bacterium]
MRALSLHSSEPIGFVLGDALIGLLLTLFLTLIAGTYVMASSPTQSEGLKPAIVDMGSYQIEID